MGKLGTFKRLITKDRDKLWQAVVADLAKSSVSHVISDKAFLKMQYKSIFHKKLNLDDPKTFNEKLQWLKLYNRDPRQVMMVDKADVKEYVAGEIGEDYIIPTLGIWDSFEEIDFDSLPDSFVLKCTHDSGSTVVCRDKATFNMEAARLKLTRKLGKNLFWHGREWPYKQVKPRIIAEELLKDSTSDDLKDYKFFCFNGAPKMVLVCAERFTGGGMRENFYDAEWKLMPVQRAAHPNTDYDIPCPPELPRMLELAEKLADAMPFVRVDFYVVDGRIYFGELTFYPASGLVPFVPDEWDLTLGEWITLPEKK